MICRRPRRLPLPADCRHAHSARPPGDTCLRGATQLCRGSPSDAVCAERRARLPLRLLERAQRRSPRWLLLRTEAVSQTNGIGAKEQWLGGQRKRDASGALLRASAGSARLICLDAERCSWRSITNNFRSVTFVKQPRRTGAAPAQTVGSSRCGSTPAGRSCAPILRSSALPVADESGHAGGVTAVGVEQPSLGGS